jgi:hypothetical protein
MLCKQEIKEGEILYYLYQGKVSEGCFIKAELPLNIVLCGYCGEMLQNRSVT